MPYLVKCVECGGTIRETHVLLESYAGGTCDGCLPSIRVMAWHFVGSKLRDGRAVPPDGEWLEHDGSLVMCKQGLHASEHPSDALGYAPGSALCRVECEGVERGTGDNADKLVCRRRRIVARIDATAILWEHARWCALQVAHLWAMPEVVGRYLETGDETIRAAAWAAARAAAWAAASDAASDAASAAASAAARDAASAAASAAASDAARDAARDAASAAASAAAWAAAWDAASAAARDAQRDHFLALVTRS